MGRRVLLVQFSAQRDGSTFSGLLSVRALQKAGWNVTTAFASEGPMVAAYEAAGCTTAVSPHKNWLRTTSVFRTLRNSAREVQNGTRLSESHEAPDLVYVNTGASLAGAVAAHRWNAPCLWHIRELTSRAGGELMVPAGLQGLARRTFHQLSTQLVANAERVAQDVLGREVPVAYNAVGPRFFGEGRSQGEARMALGLPPGVPLIGIPGTLRPMKGHPFALQSAAALAEREPEIHVAITGSGSAEYTEHVQAEIARLGLVDRVVMLGSIADMPAFYRACDVSCIPSKSEPFGRTVVESFAVGTPVVASAVGGILETVRNGENGLLVLYGDTDALTDALSSLLTNASLRGRLTEAARSDAERRFSEPVYMARIAELAEEAVARGA